MRGVSYPDVVKRVKSIIDTLKDPILVVDATGVGRAVVDLFIAAGILPYAVSIHGGDRVTNEGK